jgi:Spy/CpxP family protein refolding chaperone
MLRTFLLRTILTRTSLPRTFLLRTIFGSVVLIACAGSLLAQSTPPTTNPPAQNRPARRGGEPCWQQAGIEQSVMEQIHAIARDARSEVEAVCSNSSLTPQQRNQQAREIREKAMQKREGLITADQEKTLRACQQEQRENHPGNGGMHEGHEGMGGRGCGEMPRGGSHPGVAPNGTGNGNNNPPAPSQSSPQN